MRAAGNRVNAAIRALLTAAMLQEPRASSLLKAMSGQVAEFAHSLVKRRQWGSGRVRLTAWQGQDTWAHVMLSMPATKFNGASCIFAGKVGATHYFTSCATIEHPCKSLHASCTNASLVQWQQL